MANTNGLVDAHLFSLVRVGPSRLSKRSRYFRSWRGTACRNLKRVVLTFFMTDFSCSQGCAVHYLGVAHGDLAPRNVLRKKWSFPFKIIDFGFSDVRHTCPGWRECGELKEVRRELHLDRVEFVFRFKKQT